MSDPTSNDTNALEEFPDVETSSEGYAARFSGAAGAYLLSEQERAVGELLAPFAGGTVLEIGGGHGQLLGLYDRLGMKTTLHGSHPVCFARFDQSTLERIETIVGLPHELKLPDRSVDVVVSVRLLSHTPNWQRLLMELCRIAKHAVIIDYPSTRSLNALSPWLFGIKKRLEGNTRGFASFNGRELATVFAKAGFNDLSERRELFLPMVIHRQFGGRAVGRALESGFRAMNLTDALGSPVVLRAMRAEGS